MTAEDFANATRLWVLRSGLAPEVLLRRESGEYVVSFVVRTTKTRASHIVTRLRLMLDSLGGSRHFYVSKLLASSPPKLREELATWEICASIPVKITTANRIRLLDRPTRWSRPEAITALVPDATSKKE